MNDRPTENWRFRAAVSESLDSFNSSYMLDVWSRALARRENDPAGAVTSARTLLETVCKHILVSAGTPFADGAPLPALYKAAAEVLEIAPTKQTADVFRPLFEACAVVVEGVGKLRNHLSDSHGRGPFGTTPDWRHAELAINLSGAMATYLAAVWKGRQPTVADAMESYLAELEARESSIYRYGVQFDMLSKMHIGTLVASKVRAADLVEHCKLRASRLKPTSIGHELRLLRRVLRDYCGEEVFEEAEAILMKEKAMAEPGELGTYSARIAPESYEAYLQAFRESDGHGNSEIKMSKMIEFLASTGRSVGQVCELRWADVDFEKQTCRTPDAKETFPLLGKAWEVVLGLAEERDKKEERIFPYNHKSVIQRQIEAGYKVAAQGKPTFTLQQLRYEAICRLLDKGHQPHVVARASGQNINRVLKALDEIEGGEYIAVVRQGEPETGEAAA